MGALKSPSPADLSGKSLTSSWTFLITSASLKFPASVQATRKLPACRVGMLRKTLLGTACSGMPQAPTRNGFQVNKIKFAVLVSSCGSPSISTRIVLWCRSSGTAKRILCLRPRPVMLASILNNLKRRPTATVGPALFCLALYCTVMPIARSVPPVVLAASWWIPATSGASLAEYSHNPHSATAFSQHSHELGICEYGTTSLMAIACTRLLLS